MTASRDEHGKTHAHEHTHADGRTHSHPHAHDAEHRHEHAAEPPAPSQQGDGQEAGTARPDQQGDEDR
jgi:hydrogenase nickel incorporation protein HypB